ncbi:MAG: PBP1A family penicillin-binding protein [candidate division KSB1 bacterium]|nr:PBP1A family penicillin-binding protein [candidate division KSB1 bacterium]
MKSKIFYSFVAGASLLLLTLYGGFLWLSADLPYIPSDLRHLIYAQPTEIYADDGTLVYTLGGQRYVPLNKISPYFQKAVVAAEDGHFWRHHGIDKLAMLRAFYRTVFLGQTQGGSTITQQLAKNLFFTFKKRFLRKFKEMLVAMQLESMFTKEQILEAYCNLIYFGGTAYGVEDAAQQFFDKSASELTLAEAALLAGIINSPQALNPFSHPEAARRRQALVLQRMKRRGFIDEATYAAALTDTLVFSQRPRRSNDFIDHILTLATKRFGEEAVFFGGLKIYTTLDSDLQRLAEEELAVGLARLEAELDSTGMPLQGAIAVISIPTGEVKALVGSRKYLPGGFNRAVSQNRHVGSGIKPFIYYAAFEKMGLNPASVVVDSASMFYTETGKRWMPRNFDRRYHGPMIIKSAFLQSINVIAAQLGYQLTPRVMKETLRRFGIEAPIPEVLPLALGTVGISPLEMAAAYSIFARNGEYLRPVFLKRVEDIGGMVLDRAFIFGEERLQPAISYQVLDMMRGVIEQGTGRSVRLSGFLAPAAGKTGTSTEFTDAWFTGITTSLAASVWVGYDRIYRLYTKTGRGVTGGYGAAPIWANFMKRAMKRYPAREFRMPDGLKRIMVDPRTGWPAVDPAEGMTVVVPDNFWPGLPTDAAPRQWLPPADSLPQLRNQ